MGVEQSAPTEQSMAAESPARSSPMRPPARQDVDAASETSSVQSGDPSDRREVDALTQARSEEYRLLFRLPPDEVLVQDFNCALQENILLQGHMYLFTHHICFYSNIFGFENKKTILFQEITCVRKAKTAAIFPNAIEIVTGEKKHFFGSFLSRDEAYRLIIDGWALHSDDAKAFLDCQEMKSDASIQDYGLLALERLRGSKRSSDYSSSPDRDANISEENKSSSSNKNDMEVLSKISDIQENDVENAERMPPEEQLKWQIEDTEAPKIPGSFTKVAEAKFPICVEDFFSLFISDHASELLQIFHTRCGDKDFMCNSWRKHEQIGYIRDVSFLHPVKIYFGAKFGHCQEIQKFRVYRNSHLVIETSQQISDVPYGDHFNVEGVWDVEPDGNGSNHCLLRVYTNVAFSKKTIFRGKIEQSTKDECREVYAIWIDIANAFLKQKDAAQLGDIGDQSTATTQGDFVESESSLKLDGPLDKLQSEMASPKIPGTARNAKDLRLCIENSLKECLGCSMSLVSAFWESLVAFLSYLTSHKQFPLFFLLAVAAIILLMQMGTIALITRTPKVHVVTQGNYVSNPGSYTLENIEWLEKRFSYLNEEMLMMESRMERMRHEYAMLKAQLQSVEWLKSRS